MKSFSGNNCLSFWRVIAALILLPLQSLAFSENPDSLKTKEQVEFILEPVWNTNDMPAVSGPLTTVPSPVENGLDKKPLKKEKNKKLRYTLWKDKIYPSKTKYENIVLIEPFIYANQSTRKIKSITEKYYQIANNGKDTSRYYGDGWNTRMDLDSNGRYTNLYVIFFDENLKTDSAYLTTRYTYENNLLMKKEHFWYLTGGKEAEQRYVYDANGNIAQEYYIAMNNGREILENGRGERAVYRFNSAQSIQKEIFIYDEDAAAYILSEKVNIKTDKKGRKTNESYFKEHAKSPYRQITKTHLGDSLIIYRSLREGLPFSRTSYYNKSGDNIKTMDSTTNSVSVSESKYTYDLFNTWNTSLEYNYTISPDGEKKEELPYLIIREIEYYQDNQ